MKLAEYLSQEKLTDEAFGALVGMSQSQISRIKRGVSRPSWENLASIERVTGSLVTATDFIPSMPDAPAPEQAA